MYTIAVKPFTPVLAEKLWREMREELEEEQRRAEEVYRRG